MNIAYRATPTKLVSHKNLQASLGATTKVMASLSSELQRPVTHKFNGVLLVAYPSTDPKDLEESYYACINGKKRKFTKEGER